MALGPNTVTMKDVRIAFAQGLFTARAAQQGGEEKFGASFIFPKDHPVLKTISEKVMHVAKERWGEKATVVLQELKAKDKLPVHSGDAKASFAGYAGNLFLNAGNRMRPQVLDANKAPLTAADGKPYSGCYVNAIVEIWAQDNQYGKRINASLLGVQFVRDGERLAGGSVATADDFEPIPGAEAAGGDIGQANGSAGSLFD